MFNLKSNTPLNTLCLVGATLPDMHQSTARLYEAALALKNAVGPSAVARLLNQSAQTVKNWESRGVSREGAIEAQSLLHISASWIMDGKGPMMASSVEARIQGASGSFSGGAISAVGSNSPVTYGVAQPLTLDVSTVPILMSWGEMMQSEPVPLTFKVATQDDALGALTPRGTVIHFRRVDPDFKPGVEDDVLIEDRHGDRHIRACADGGPGRHWVAASRNPLHWSFEQERDGFTLLAVATGRDGSRV